MVHASRRASLDVFEPIGDGHEVALHRFDHHEVLSTGNDVVVEPPRHSQESIWKERPAPGDGQRRLGLNIRRQHGSPVAVEDLAAVERPLWLGPHPYIAPATKGTVA